MILKKVSAILLLLVACILLSIGAFHLWLHQEPPASVDTAENALASKNLFLIGHMNHERLIATLDLIDTAVNSDVDDPSPFSPPGIKTNIWNALYEQGPQFRENIDQIIIGMSAGTEPGTATTDLIISGRFSANTVLETLKTGFEVDTHGANNYRLKQISDEPEKRICPTDQKKLKVTSPYIWLHISEHWLLLSSEQQRLEELLTRLSQQSSAEVNLANWREYRKNRLTSIGLLTPQSAASSGGMTGFIVGGAAKNNPQVSDVFAGADLSYQPVGAAFNVQINTSDSQWLTSKHAEAVQQLDKINAEAKSLSPALAELISGLSVDAQDSRLNIDAVIELATIKKIPEMFTDAIASMFSFGSPQGQSNTVSAEQINGNPWNYANNNRLNQLPPFKPGDFNKNVMYTDGPFAVDISSVSLGEKSGLPEIGIETLLQIPEIEGRWWDSKAETTLIIDKVMSHDGRELMRDELCIKDEVVMFGKNRDPQKSPLSVNQGKASARKTIRLVEGSRFDEVDYISGKLTLTAPVQVKAISLEYRQGAKAEHDGVRVFIRQAGKQEVSYRVSGEQEKLVEVRAFNQKGQTLRQGSSWSSADGNSSVSYYGDISKLVVYIAEKKLRKQFTFKLPAKDFYRYQSDEKAPLSGIPEITPVSADDWKKLEQLEMAGFKRDEKKHRYYNGEKQITEFRQAPFMLSFFHNDKSSWDSSLKFELYSPMENSLINNLGALQLNIQSQDNSKTFNRPIIIKPAYSFNDQERKFIEYAVDSRYQDTDYMRASTSLDIGVEKQQAVQQLQGELMVRLPEKITTQEIALPTFGKPVESAGMVINLESMTRGMIPRIRFSLSGKIGSLLQVSAISQANENIQPAQIDFQDGKWMVQFDLRDDIEKLQLLTAEQQIMRRYPFDLKVNYSE